MMKTFTVAFLCFFLLLSPMSMLGIQQEAITASSLEFGFHQSIRKSMVDAVIVSESDPFLSLISTSVACWYDKIANTTGLLPLLVTHEGDLTDAQTRFLETYFTSDNHTLLILGEHLNTSYHTIELLGSASEIAIALATQVFTTAPSVLILPYDTMDAYQLSLLAAPLASYLNLPILISDKNDDELQAVCTQLQTTHAYLVGNSTLNITNVTVISLLNEDAITDTILTVIKDHFGSINYLTMANPSDVIPPSIINTTKTTINEHIINKKVIILSKEFDIVGNDTRQYSISVPDGVIRLQISAEIFQNHGFFVRLFVPVVPVLFMTLTDTHGQIVAYANSMGYDIGKTYLETLICNASGSYTLQITVYNGIKGGYFMQRGISRVNANVTIMATISTLSSPHLPLIPKLSSMAAYLTAAHGGLIIANASWELTDSSYVSVAQGSGTGPWYNESLHPFTNMKVNTTVQQLERTLESLNTHGLLSGYLQGPAWLAILADTTMIPMYYYGPSQEDIPDRGLPSDNPYSVNQNLSVGRLISWDVQDCSVLIARTFFYETLCGPPGSLDDWHYRFSFVFGEGFAETGGIFHQIPYAKEIRKYGFTSKVYGDFRNSRQIAELLHVYTGANYIEYLGHGDWFWFAASLYGLDIYSKAIDVAHAKNWVYDKPSIFLTSACLMGRTDGLPPQMNIGLAMLHAGCNGFVGATRETGQESGLTVLENHLIVDDWSVGEALRGEKRIDTELPTFYVRVFYGDPAFNPFDPQHGFSSQGRPIFTDS
ncbi:MAG TPA: C25 family cysteine peptidase [Candidatus Thermoplasmatota archaeon]|nr:C25 family cysteine peptidase [Candidatus Thermoplasmatota archaeon]